MGSISCHIMPLVINSLGADTHTHKHTHTHTDIHTETILRNQAHAARDWYTPGLIKSNQISKYLYKNFESKKE